jgi:hypothetical protein
MRIKPQNLMTLAVSCLVRRGTLHRQKIAAGFCHAGNTSMEL